MSNTRFGDLDAFTKGLRPSDLNATIALVTAASKALLHESDPATRKAVLLLIAHTSGLKQKHVKRVLEAASHLQRKYTPR